MQNQLLKLIISVVTLATFVAALHGYNNSQDKLEDMFDRELATIANFILSQTTHSAERTSPDYQNGDIVYQVLDRDHHVLFASDNTPQKAITQQTSGFSEHNFSSKRWRTFSAHNEQFAVIVAQSINYRRKAAQTALMSTILPLVIALPLIGIMIFYVVKKTIKPLKQLSYQLKHKNSEDLSAVTVPNMSSELDPVVERLNDLLKRLNYAFELEKQLSANAAHELRTPISVLSIAANNLRHSFHEKTLNEQQFVELSASVDRMAHVIEQIIHLFRFTPESFEKKLGNVDLESVLQQVVSNNYLAIEDANQQIELEASAICLQADEFALYVLFENLIRNANKYAGAKTNIKITLAEKADKVNVTIEDSGAGLPLSEMQKLTERFYRSKNQQNVKGSGLGLAIVKHVTELHHGTLDFSKSELGGLKVSVHFPKIYKHAS